MVSRKEIFMDKDEIVAGLGEINAFCEVFLKDFHLDSDIVKRWKEYTDEAIKLLNRCDNV